MATTEVESEFKADVQDQLFETFLDDPRCETDANGAPSVPAGALLDVLREYADRYSDGHSLLTAEEEMNFQALAAANPDVPVTLEMILDVIATRVREAENASPERVRPASRASSRSHSRPPSRAGPSVPATPTSAALDKRQRSQPLGAAGPPSSWAKPAPASRRKSVDGAGSHHRALSDTESSGASPSAYRTPAKHGRNRAPSNPPSLSQSNSEPYILSGGSYSRPASRAGSRSSSRPGSRQGRDYYSPEPQHTLHAPVPLDLTNLNSIPMPARDSDSDSDSDGGGDDMVPMWAGRAGTISISSMDDEARILALEAARNELARQLREATDTLTRRVAAHEAELEELNIKLEDVKAELSASRHAEKQLLVKERSSVTTIGTLEAEVARLQKALDTNRASYSALNKQYQEQCAESERYRNNLRMRDQDFKELQDQTTLSSMEATKWQRDLASSEERTSALEHDLALAQAAHAQLDDQKQENLLLKETIDRLRFEMDAIRTNSPARAEAASREATVSRSLGAEMARGLGGLAWDAAQREEEEQAETETVVDEDSDTEDETEIQTIITRKKKKVSSRANKVETIRIEETKEYSDAYTQYERSEFVASSSAQTDPPHEVPKASFGAQTEELPVRAMDIQTEPEPAPPPPPPRFEMDIQTEPEPAPPPAPPRTEMSIQTEPERTPTPPPAASSSREKEPPADLPPAYDDDGPALLAKLHPGAPELLDDGLPAGVPLASVADWAALKAELGVGCAVLDRLIAASAVRAAPTPLPTPALPLPPAPAPAPAPAHTSGAALARRRLQDVLLCAGASAAVVLALAPALAAHAAIPGGPTYYDRAAWSSYNALDVAREGFAGADGTAAVWDFVGRLGGGAARQLRGWPT